MSSSPLPQDPSAGLTGIDPGTRQYLRSLWIAEDYDDYFTLNALFKFDSDFLERLFPQPLRLLDLGCGTGRHLVHFARKGFEVTGVDLSEHMLRVASEKIESEALKARLVRSNLCRIEGLDDASFDAAICMFSTLGMIRGAKNRLACLREACRLLGPGGTLVVHAHNFLYQGYLPETWLNWVKSLALSVLHGYELGDKVLPQYRAVQNMYLHQFTPGEMQRLLRAAGFRSLRLAYINSPRTGELGPAMFRALRANGFLAVARKPDA